MTTRYCYACASDAILEVDSAAGNSVCTTCGTVLEENAIVSEITFGETSGGAAMVQGSHIGADQTRARAPAGYRQKGGAQESREQTLLNGKKRIQALATALRLPDRLADAGQRYFNLAVTMNFVQGRRTQYVVAACLYSACRMDRTSHMLIDFSDLLEINVFVLGSTYLKLTRSLSLSLPTVDPSLYITRFATLLDFGPQTASVTLDAVRLSSRMSRDWITLGRRPSGISGACLLLAARMNGFRRTVKEVVQVVKIADGTLRKRLKEFGETRSGELTVEDFRTLWLEEGSDPPAFVRSQREEKREREKRAEEGSLMGDEEYDEVEERRAFVEMAREDADLGDAEMEDEGQPALGIKLVPSEKALGKRKRIEDDADVLPVVLETPQEEEDPLLDAAIEGEIAITLDTDASRTMLSDLDAADAARKAAANAMTNLNTSGRLDDLDEDELDAFILTEDEAESKGRLWMENNKEYLQALADKQTGPDGELKPEAKRRIRKRHKPRDSLTATGTDAADSTKQLLTRKKFSKKIDYAAIDDLFRKDQDGDGASANGGSRAGTPVRRGYTPIHIPMPTFSRGTTPRAVSEAPRTPGAEEPDAEEEEEEPEGGMDPPPVPRGESRPEVAQVEVSEQDDPEAEEGDDWSKLFKGYGDDVQDDYEEEI